MKKFDDAGLQNVWLANGFATKDTAYVDPAVKYGEISTLSPTPLLRFKCALVPSRERGLNFPLPSWERDRGRGGDCATGLNIFRCRINGVVEIINEVPGLTRAMCVALAGKIGRLSGAEFRYLRLHLRPSQKSLTQCFCNTEHALAMWGKTGRVPLWADKHLRILWKAQEAGNETVKNVVDRINLIDQLVNQKIVVEEPRRGWKGSVEDEPVAA